MRHYCIKKKSYRSIDRCINDYWHQCILVECHSWDFWRCCSTDRDLGKQHWLSSSEGCQQNNVNACNAYFYLHECCCSITWLRAVYFTLSQGKGLIWGFTVTVICYKNELLQTSVLSLDCLNTKYHDFSFEKHLFSWPMPSFSAPSEHSLNTDLQSMPLCPPLFLFSLYIITAGCMLENYSLIVPVEGRGTTLY